MYEQLYSRYVRLIERDDDSNFVSLCCPFHDDKSASAGIAKDTGVFNCFVDGALSPVQFFTKFLNNEEEAKKIVADFRQENRLITNTDTFSKKSKPVYNAAFEELYKLSQEFMTPDIPVIQAYMEARQLNYETLLHYKVGYLPASYTRWKKDSVVFPYFYDGKVVGIRYRDSDCNKDGEKDCHFTLWGIDNILNQETVVVVEGESDCLKTYQALNGEFTVVSTPTATFKRVWEREFEDVEQVILIRQEDEASVKMVTKASEILGDKLKIVELPWKKREFGNDVCDWLGTRPETDLQELIQTNKVQQYQKVLSGYDLCELANSQQQWIIKGLLAKRQACLIGGGPKTMKTWLAFNMIRCLIQYREFFVGIPELSCEIENPKIMFIQEEGNAEELKTRAEKVLKDLPWQKYCYFMHRLGVKLDSPYWADKLTKIVEKYKINILFIDPFQRTHSADENDAKSIGTVWGTIDALLSKFPDLCIVILHHFKKSGDISEGWNAFRGSGRIAAETDLGIFVEKLPKSKGSGIKIKIDGRSIPQITGADNSDIIRLMFDDGIFTMDTGATSITTEGKWLSLVVEIEEKRFWYAQDAAQHYGISIETLKNWVKKLDKIGYSHIEFVKGSTRAPAHIFYNELKKPTIVIEEI